MSVVLMNVQVFLIGTRAGSAGINLVSARRLVLYDQLWYPVHNKQVRNFESSCTFTWLAPCWI